MSCRLFIDEVGNDDTKHPSERFLSVTGIITKVHGHSYIITPEIEKLKSDLFNHNPPKHTVVLHRKEIVRKEHPFDSLQDPAINAQWEQRILQLVSTLPYIAITVIIDKHELVQKYSVWRFNPYHYCMRALVERYVLWLNRHRLTGDVVAEPRYKGADKKLKKSFSYIYDHGTENISASIVQSRLTSRNIGFAAKSANVCGLQLVEMIAHPSHQALRALYTGQPMTAAFGSQIEAALVQNRYARNPKTRVIDGWGQKRLP